MSLYGKIRRLRYLRVLAGSNRRALSVYVREVVYFNSLPPTNTGWRRVAQGMFVYGLVRKAAGRTPERISVETLKRGQRVEIAALPPSRRRRRR
jgi:hypothetical protein